MGADITYGPDLSVVGSLEAVLDHLEGSTDANTVTDLRPQVATLRAFSHLLPDLMEMPTVLAEILVALNARMNDAENRNAAGVPPTEHAAVIRANRNGAAREAREARNEAVRIAARLPGVVEAEKVAHG
jgi:hypothetical protein